MLNYSDINISIGPKLISLAKLVEFDGFDPNVEFTDDAITFILSKDYTKENAYINNKCSFNNCLRVAYRNNMCKIHNIYVTPEEKCKKIGCDNLRCIYKKDKHIFCHKHRTNIKNQTKKSCSISGCNKLAKRNKICKTHNLSIYSSFEKCKVSACNNLKDFSKKNRNDFCYKHK